jgi:hypothetical protein
MSIVVFTKFPIWGSICLAWVNLAYTRAIVEIPKFLGAASKTLEIHVASLEHDANPKQEAKLV